jgi:hypothetical protein
MTASGASGSKGGQAKRTALLSMLIEQPLHLSLGLLPDRSTGAPMIPGRAERVVEQRPGSGLLDHCARQPALGLGPGRGIARAPWGRPPVPLAGPGFFPSALSRSIHRRRPSACRSFP